MTHVVRKASFSRCQQYRYQLSRLWETGQGRCVFISLNPSQRWCPEQVFVYRHPVDMRKQILGLSNIVSMQLGRDPGDESMYVYVNKGRDKIKLLIWHCNGFWLLYKRLERQRFHWPDENRKH